MDFYSKLRSTVTSTVSHLSGVLPGNPVTREFEVVSHICSAGPGLLWKVYHGYKKSTKQEAAVFVFEKRLLERWPRESRDSILESLKRGVTQLTKLRHPQVLIVQHPLEESRESLAFATEPVFASLANLLGNTDNMPTPTPFKDYNLFEVEIKYGLLQIGEGLCFLHNDVKLLHHNISPEVIVINYQGAWKIFGFDFCILNESKPDGQGYWPVNDYSTCIPHVSQPNLDYLAPDVLLTNTQTTSSDIYSLGQVIYTLHNDGKSLLNCSDDFSSYKRKINELKNLHVAKLHSVPEGLREYVKMMLNMTPELRPDAHQFIKLNYFEDVGVKTLNYLDSLFQWDKVQKSQFYKGLSPIIKNLPHRVNLHRVIPCLAKEFTNPTMIPFVLPSVLQIAENCTKEEYMQHIFTYLKPVMKMTDPVQILLVFMQKMELLLKLTPADEVKTDVLPMLYHALESDTQQIQELCLSVLPNYATLIDYPSMKNALLPRVKRLCIGTGCLSVRVNCLLCVGKLLENLDKWLVLDEVLPFLPQIPSREPAVLMVILGIYKIALAHKKLGIPKEIIATKIVPFLMPMTIENNLTLNQFHILFAVLKDMISRVENEQRTKIEQLSAISQQTNSLNSFNTQQTEQSSTLQVTQNPVKTDLESIFSTLDIAQEKMETVSSNNKTSANLTMEEKQRLVKQQETQKMLMMSQPVQPSVVNKPVVTPKDLTDTLLETNLNQMKTMNNWTSNSNTSSQQSLAWQPTFNNFSTTPTALGNQGFVSSPPHNFQPVQSFRPNFMPTMSMSTMSSAFPNMTLGSGSGLQNQPAKPLSSSEINDLLS